MGLYHNSSRECKSVVGILNDQFQSLPANLTSNNMSSLQYCCDKLSDWDVQEKYNKPMVWVGMYVAIASLCCVLAMVADLLHGFRKRKLWFPCKCFSLNAASIMAIGIAMKLPMDLSSPMPSDIDQTAKVLSMLFMCTIIANLLPSLASMDNMALVANVIGLNILVITLIGNICIQIKTGVIDQTHHYNTIFSGRALLLWTVASYRVAAFWISMIILWLLNLMSFSAIMIPNCKQILESKYQATIIAISNHQHNGICVVEKLRQHVKIYWIMAETGNPQFMMASTSSFVSGWTCIFCIVGYIIIVTSHIHQPRSQSDYKWSILAIVITQSIGIVLGSFAPILRWFTVFSFSLNSFLDDKGRPDLKVKTYWTKNLYEWKEIPIPFLFGGLRLRTTFVHHFRNFILSICIVFQNVAGVLGNILQGIVLLLVFRCLYTWNSLKDMWFNVTIPNASNNDDANEDLGRYVLLLEDRMKLTGKALKRISNSVSCLIQAAEKEQPNHLLKFLEKSTGFQGVMKFDNDQVQPLLSVELPNNWSLTVITLTCIAIALLDTEKDIADSLFTSVDEGLTYIHLVEENLNNASAHVTVQKAALMLWNEVRHNRTWLKYYYLERSAHEGVPLAEILKLFAKVAKETVTELETSTNGELVDQLPRRLIVANSMYRIAETIMITFQSNIEQVSQEELFGFLCSMIADIMSACLTNIPQVIRMKCEERVIEKREASVEAAAKLLGKTTKIIERLETCELPPMDPDKMAFIDEWRSHYEQPIP